MKYAEEQIGWIVNSVIIFLIFFVFFIYLFRVGSNPIKFIPMITTVVVLIFIFLVLFKFEIKIDDKYIRLTFGIGILRRKILLNEISEVLRVKNKWYWGWGIHYFLGGVLYNIQGFNAIELKLKNNVIRIDIASNSMLEREIKNRIKI